MQHLVHLHRRLLVAVVATLAVSSTAALPAYAAPPSNDSIRSPRAISTVPVTLVQDSSQATADREDGRCALGASVWYRYRPTKTRTLRVVTVGSDYDTILGVSRGSRSHRREMACSDDAADLAGALRVRFVKGETYWIVVSACCRRSERGGDTVLSLYASRAAAVTTTLESVESGGVSGRLFLSGTVTCASPSVVFLSAEASQRVGDAVARGFGDGSVLSCTEVASDWRLRIDSETGWAFSPGTAAIDLSTTGVDGFSVAQDDQQLSLTVTDDPGSRHTSRATRRP